MNIWNSIKKIIDAASSFSAKIAMGCIFAIVFLIGFDVFCRYVLNSPLLWSDEISSFLLVSLAFLGASETLKQEKHITVEVITLRLSQKNQLRLSIATSVISSVMLCIFSTHCAAMVYKSYVRGVTTPSILLAPLWIPQTVMFIGALLLTLQMIIETGKAIRNFRAK